MAAIDFHPYLEFPGMPAQLFTPGVYYWGSFNGTLGQAAYNNGWHNFSPLKQIYVRRDCLLLQTEADGGMSSMNIAGYKISDNITSSVFMTTHNDVHFIRAEIRILKMADNNSLVLDTNHQNPDVELDNEEIQLATLFVDICKRPELVRPFVGKALAQAMVEAYTEDFIKVIPFFAILMRRLLLASNCYNKDKLLPEGSDAYKLDQVAAFFRRVVAVANKVPMMMNVVNDDSTRLHYFGLFNTLCGDDTATEGG